MTTPTSTRPAETEALLAALHGVAPNALTACPEWTAHDIGAHLAAACEEVTRHLRAYADGRPLTSTRSFEEREAPFRGLSYARLLDALDRGEETMRAEIGAILAREPDAALRWTGRQMRVDAFLTHLRSECALHRWDLAGDDETSWRLLGNFELFKHAVTAIGAGPMTARGVAAGAAQAGPFTARLRSDGHPDLTVTVSVSVSDAAAVRLSLAETDGEASIVADQAARLLVLWGRMPQPAGRVLVSGPHAFRVRSLLSGY
jgi:mycothiol maleylpyruvate isomerase-like protein